MRFSRPPLLLRPSRAALLALVRPARAAALALAQTARRRRRHGPLRPSWSFETELLFAFLRNDWRTLWHEPIDVLRAYLEAIAPATPRDRRITRRRARVGGVEGEWLAAPGVGDDRNVLVYFHGGSYLFGSTRTHADTIERFALATRVPVFAPNYRLAPEHPWPAQLEDARAVVRELARDGFRIVVAGESAGGHLVLALALALRDAGLESIAGAAALSPWIDLEARSASYARNAAFDWGSREMLVAQAKLVAASAPVASVSLTSAVLRGVAPLYLVAGDAELLFDETRALAQRARDEGVDVTFDVLEDMPHAAQNLASFVPEGARSIERIGAWLRARLG